MSITLTNPFTVSSNGALIENDLSAACISLSIDYLARTYTVVFQTGNLAGSPPNLVPGAYSQMTTVTVYVGPNTATLKQGNWWLNGILQSSIIPGATLSSYMTQILGDRNTAEVNTSTNLLPGTQVPWTAL